MEAAARELEGFKGFKRLKPGKRQKLTARGLGGSCREVVGGF